MAPPLLVRLGLSEPNPWEPPTVLDRFIASPLRAGGHFLWKLVCWLRSWRGLRLSTPDNLRVRVVCISDTHDQIVPNVPDGDLLIHAGDLTNEGHPDDLQKQIDWIASLPHQHKVIICGNHDTWFDPAARKAKGWSDLEGPVFPPGVHYLEHSTVGVSFPNRGSRQLTIYGAPDIPRCGPDTFAFQYERPLPPWERTVPANTDILITHPPPRTHRDLSIGCYGLLAEAWRIRPRLHVFGHIHWGAGREIVYWDDAQRAYEAILDDRPQTVKYPALASVSASLSRASHLLVLLLCLPKAFLSLVSPFRPPPSTVFINAAQMYGNSGKMGTHNTQVIDL